MERNTQTGWDWRSSGDYEDTRIGSESSREEDRGGIISRPTPIEETTIAVANGERRMHLYPEYQVSRVHVE